MLNCCRAWQKGRAAALKAPPETPVTALEGSGSCPVPLRKGIAPLQPCGGFQGEVVGSPDSSHVLPQARSSLLFPSTFSASPLLPGSARAFRTPLPSSPAFCFPLAVPQEALQKGKGESLGPAGGFSRQQHKVPFVTPCAFDQPVKGSSKVKKKKSRANAVNEADAGKRHVQAQSVVPGVLCCSATCLGDTAVAACLLMLSQG